MERIQKRAMRIIHGYDTPYDIALELSSLERLSAYRDNLCDDLLLKVSRNTEDKLHNLLPFNTNRNLPLRNIRKFSVPKCNTDRFKNYFINIAAIVVTMSFIVNSYSFYDNFSKLPVVNIINSVCKLQFMYF